jgi:hypothetical protein
MSYKKMIGRQGNESNSKTAKRNQLKDSEAR